MDIIAVDIGTASVSAALMRRGKHAAEIVTVLREPFDLFKHTEEDERAKRAGFVISQALRRIFSEAHRTFPHPDNIRISFSDPFFEEHQEEISIERKNADRPIHADEVASAYAELQKKAEAVAGHHLRVVSGTLTHQAINGYPIDSAAGFRGKALDLGARFLLVSAVLKDHINECVSTFFPKTPISYFAESTILARTLERAGAKKYPAIILDIGGELTSVTLVTAPSALQNLPPVFLGMRTMGRNVASVLGVAESHAEALLKQYSKGVLGEDEKNRVDQAMNTTLGRWWGEISSRLSDRVRSSIAHIALSGGGRDFPPIAEYLAHHAIGQGLTNPGIVPLAIPSEALSSQALSSGGDTILASLLFYAES